ncbi:MAG: adenylate/guanylate cyclase domain-containing protein [Ectothiorhodospiraceae bacterium]|nr:adenylate/guanylate cyclase domain-containing protein [Chromatiales bacterium]MCP5157075.1 adenylate/guanylate cyclase domain-containing protein [Ectothiorhodospiraceae bacterium]
MATLTRTILFTDLANYTDRVSRSDREQLHRLLKAHEGLVRPLVESRGGTVVKNIGDSFLCVFPSATDALRATLDILDASARVDSFALRVAVATGDVEEIDGDVFGDAVNLAARILHKAPAGEGWFSAGTRVCMNDAEIPWESVGRFALKGITGEQKCYRVVPPDRCWLPPPVVQAARRGALVRIEGSSTALPSMPPDPVVLLEGLLPGSRELRQTLARLPVLDPSAIYLNAYRIATVDRQGWSQGGHGLVVSTVQALDAAVKAETADAGLATGDVSGIDFSETMSITRIKRRTPGQEVVLCGIALPAVPFSEVVAGYTYDLIADGSWVAHSDSALLRVEVSPRGVMLRALSPGVAVGGKLLGSGEPVPLSEWSRIATAAGEVTFVPLSGGYRGLLAGQATNRIGLTAGQKIELGRSPEPPGLAFPTRPGGKNIRWCVGERASQARANGFTLDRVLAGRRQLALTLGERGVEAQPLHTECPTYLVRDGRLGRVTGRTVVKPGDYLVSGTALAMVRNT